MRTTILGVTDPAPLPLAYDDLPPGSDIRRDVSENAGRGAVASVYLTVPASAELPPAVARQARLNALVASVPASVVLLGAVVCGVRGGAADQPDQRADAAVGVGVLRGLLRRARRAGGVGPLRRDGRRAAARPRAGDGSRGDAGAARRRDEQARSVSPATTSPRMRVRRHRARPRSDPRRARPRAKALAPRGRASRRADHPDPARPRRARTALGRRDGRASPGIAVSGAERAESEDCVDAQAFQPPSRRSQTLRVRTT